MIKITFVYPDFESLGVAYLMAICLKNGYEVDFVYYQAEDISLNKREKNISFQQIAEQIAGTYPHVVAFSCVTDNYQFQKDCAKAVKSILPKVVTIFGGIHVTAVPENVLKSHEVDCIAIGEAEISFPLFLDKCEITDGGLILPSDSIPGIVFKKDGQIIGDFVHGELADLNVLPFPYKKPFYASLKAFSHEYKIMTSRGCPYKCSYCFNSYINEMRGKSIIRRRTVENVIAELLWAKENYSFKYVLFLDDSFTTNKEWLIEFCKQYKERINLPFACIAIPQYIDKEKAEALSRAGCIDMQIGVQSISEQEICQKILHRKSDNKKIAQTIRLLRDAGIIVQVDHMLGVPEDTLEIQEQSVLFYNQFRPNRISVFWLTYYPKTPIIEIALQKGILSEDDVNDINDGVRLTAASSYTGGSMRDPSPYYGIAFLLNYIPLMPKWLVKFLVIKRLYRIFSIRNFLISTAFPRALQSIFNRKDFRGRSNMLRFINKYLRARSITGKIFKG